MGLKMTRSRWILLIVALGVLGGLGGLGALLKHEPGFYRRAAVPPGQERKTLSAACLGRFTQLLNCLNDGYGKWDIKMSQGQLNSFFDEDYVRLGLAKDFAKHGISEPRVLLEEDRLRLGFRFGTGLWSTVVSYDLRLWLAPRDVNVVAIEILGRKAGALPLTTQALLKEITEVAKRRNIDVSWYRHEGNPVALVRFQADRPRPTFQLQRLDLRSGFFNIGGVSLEPLQNLEGDLKGPLKGS